MDRSHDDLLRDAAARFGTPVYLYDLTRITAQVTELREAFPTARIHYAVKANASGAVLRHIASLGLGAEALTIGELERSLRAGFPAANIVLGGPGITPELAQRALMAGVGVVSLDGEGAYDAFKQVMGRPGAPTVSAPPRFLVRLNPGFDPHTHEHLATAAATSKFGVPMQEAERLAERVAADGGLAGFHVHAGSMLRDAEVASMVVRSLEPLYERFQGLELVDVGGGFAVPGAPLEAFAAEYAAFAQRFGVTPIVEPGRVIVAEAGVLLTRVLHVKGSAPRHVIADAGMADLLRPALYGAEHPVRMISGASEQKGVTTDHGAEHPVRAVSGASDQAAVSTDVDGPLCENADRLAQDVQLGEVAAGDLLSVGQAGAYGFAMASNYASSLRAAEAVWDGEELRLARRRETPEDLWRLET